MRVNISITSCLWAWKKTSINFRFRHNKNLRNNPVTLVSVRERICNKKLRWKVTQQFILKQVAVSCRLPRLVLVKFSTWWVMIKGKVSEMVTQDTRQLDWSTNIRFSYYMLQNSINAHVTLNNGSHLYLKEREFIK